MKIELFAEEDLQFNITKHRLQPKFEKLKDSEAVDFKKNFGIKFGILRLDRPIARFYNYQKGDVIRITRNDGYINYRIVKG
jgi:DNA-directed RNA polymerase subunit H (RpoH/RPB5)